jgi:hypothetical protein
MPARPSATGKAMPPAINQPRETCAGLRWTVSLRSIPNISSASLKK